MQISVKMMGVLKDKTPPNASLELPDGATIDHALAALDVPRKLVQIVSINGDLIRDFERVLEENDELTLLAPVAGG